MANTLSGPYTPNTWVEGSSDLGATRMSHLETQASVALGSLNPDVVASGFVLSGALATRHNSYSAAVLADTPDRYYRLDETSGASAADSGAALQNATYVASPTLGAVGALTGDPDAAVTFNGTTQYAYNGVSNDLPSGAGAFTLECWIKTAGGVLQDFLMIGDYDTGNHNVLLQWTNTNFVKVLSNGGTAGVTSDAALSLNTWHHIAATYDGATLRLFVDGVQQSTSAAVTLALAYVGSYPLVIGATSSGATHTTPQGFFSGSMDEAALYKAALSSTRISAHYTAGTTATTQLDIASGVAYLIQSDGSLARCAIGTASETTSALSSTYYLDLNPDGSWSWATTHSAVANHLTIASVTTDGSGNVSVVSDLRVTQAALFSGLGSIQLPAVAEVGSQTSAGSFGVPVIVAQAFEVLVTATTAQNILSFTPPVKGMYRVSAIASMNNSAQEDISLWVSYTAADTGSVFGPCFYDSYQGAVLNGTHLAGPVTQFHTAPITIWASSATPIIVKYQDPGGTPSDRVSAIIERLS